MAVYVVYKMFAGDNPNLRTGELDVSFDEESIDTVLSASLINADRESAMRVFRFRVDDLPEFPPSRKSVILFEERDYLISDYQTDSTESFCDIHTKRP